MKQVLTAVVEPIALLIGVGALCVGVAALARGLILDEQALVVLGAMGAVSGGLLVFGMREAVKEAWRG